MKNIIKLSILFMSLLLVFFTIPSINKIQRYKNSLPKLAINAKGEMPKIDSYILSQQIENLIEKSDVQKKKYSSQFQDSEMLDICVYEMELKGKWDNLSKLFDEIIRIEGAKLRLVEWTKDDNSAHNVSGSDGILRLQILFAGGK